MYEISFRFIDISQSVIFLLELPRKFDDINGVNDGVVFVLLNKKLLVARLKFIGVDGPKRLVLFNAVESELNMMNKMKKNRNLKRFCYSYYFYSSLNYKQRKKEKKTEKKFLVSI